MSKYASFIIFQKVQVCGVNGDGVLAPRAPLARTNKEMNPEGDWRSHVEGFTKTNRHWELLGKLKTDSESLSMKF